MLNEVIARQMSVQLTSGYWKVEDKCFFNKRECLLYASKIKNYSVTFHFLDDIYQSVDWSTEPTKTLDQLYFERALQLREKYDYLILMFSGGSDSNNILDTFLKNNIPINEVVAFYPVQIIEKTHSKFNINDTKNSNLMFEFTTAAMPKLKKISQSHPNIKISVIDWANESIDLCSKDLMIDVDMCSSGNFSPTVAQYKILTEIVRDRHKTHQRIAVISGIDKPRIGYDPKTEKIGTWIDDISVTFNNFDYNSLDGFRPKIEFFYYTPDMIDIWKKQCQVIKRAIYPMAKHYPRPKIYSDLHSVSRQNNEIFNVHHNFFKKILYSTWDTSIYQADKPSSHWYNETSAWFWSDLNNKRIKDYYSGQLNNFISGIDPKFIVWRGETRKPIRFIDMKTKPIHISSS
jgi:hypothetical protein